MTPWTPPNGWEPPDIENYVHLPLRTFVVARICAAVQLPQMPHESLQRDGLVQSERRPVFEAVLLDSVSKSALAILANLRHGRQVTQKKHVLSLKKRRRFWSNLSSKISIASAIKNCEGTLSGNCFAHPQSLRNLSQIAFMFSAAPFPFSRSHRDRPRPPALPMDGFQDHDTAVSQP